MKLYIFLPCWSSKLFPTTKLENKLCFLKRPHLTKSKSNQIGQLHVVSGKLLLWLNIDLFTMNFLLVLNLISLTFQSWEAMQSLGSNVATNHTCLALLVQCEKSIPCVQYSSQCSLTVRKTKHNQRRIAHSNVFLFPDLGKFQIICRLFYPANPVCRIYVHYVKSTQKSWHYIGWIPLSFFVIFKATFPQISPLALRWHKKSANQRRLSRTPSTNKYFASTINTLMTCKIMQNQNQTQIDWQRYIVAHSRY